MIATLAVDTLLTAAARVGVTVTRAEVDGNLYVWHTPEDDVVYIGKSASNKRTADERRWRELDPSAESTPALPLCFVSIVRCCNRCSTTLMRTPPACGQH